MSDPEIDSERDRDKNSLLTAAASVEPEKRLTFASAALNGAFIGFSRIYYLCLRVVYVVFLVQFIGVEYYGYYSYAQNWYVMLLPLAIFGTNELLISGLLRQAESERSAFIGTGLALRVLLGAACALAIVLAAFLLEDRSDLRLPMVIFAQAVVVRGVISWYSSLFAARGGSIYWLRLSIIFMALEVMVVLLLAANDASLSALAAAQCAIWWTMLVASASVYRRRYSPVRFSWSSRWLIHYLRGGVTIGAATFLLFCMTPGLLITYRYLVEDLQRLGEMALVLQVFQIADQLILVVSNSLLAALHSQDDAGAGRALANFLRFGCLQALYLGAAGVILCVVLIPLGLELLPDTPFDTALMTFADYAWIGIPLLALHAVRLVLISLRAQRAFLWSMIIGVLCMFLFVLVAHALQFRDSGSYLLAMGFGFATATIFQLLFARHFLRRKIVDPRSLVGATVAALGVVMSYHWEHTALIPLAVALLLCTLSWWEFRGFRGGSHGS